MQFPTRAILNLGVIGAVLMELSSGFWSRGMPWRSRISKHLCQGRLKGRSKSEGLGFVSRFNAKLGSYQGARSDLELSSKDIPLAEKEVSIESFPGCGLRSAKALFNNSYQSKTSNKKLRGDRKPTLKFRIAGGTESSARSWPWMVALFRQGKDEDGKEFLCGGSLISTQYMLTAAHCFDKDAKLGKIDPSKYSVKVGSINVEQGTEYEVKSVKNAPNHKVGGYIEDISILKLSPAVALSSEVRPVCLPSKPYLLKDMEPNQKVTVTGWGSTSYQSKLSPVLREVNVSLIPLEKCIKSYKRIPGFISGVLPELITRGTEEDYICAGEWKGGKDACEGDSGGPMVIQNENGRWEQLGIVSFGYRCAKAKYPGLYTRVAKYKKWIYENTDLEGN